MHYYLFALLAGAASTIQAGINGTLSSNLGSPLLASFISFLVGSIGLFIAYILTAYYGLQPLPTLTSITQTNYWMWLGGLLGAFLSLQRYYVHLKLALPIYLAYLSQDKSFYR